MIVEYNNPVEHEADSSQNTWSVLLNFIDERLLDPGRRFKKLLVMTRRVREMDRERSVQSDKTVA